MAKQNAILGSISFELTQAGVNTALDLLAEKKHIPIPPLNIDAGILGYLKIEGFIDLDQFKITILKDKGTGSANISPSFTIEYQPKIGKIIKKSFNICFQSPQFGVELNHDQTKTFMCLCDIDFSMDIQKPEWILEPIWELLRGAIKEFKEIVRRAINTELRQHPFELFDLSLVPDFNLKEKKTLKVKLNCEICEFHANTLKYKMNVHKK